jgi:hypothetical protein
MTAEGNNWVPYVQGSDGVVISPKKLALVTVISQGRIDENPDNGREIQQGDKDWHPILTWTGVVTG